MSIELITILLFSSFLVVMFLGLPIAFSFGGIAVIFTLLLWGVPGLFMVSAKTYDMMSTIIMVAVPMFIFMACVLERSGLADTLYTMMHRWLGPLRGGLAVGTVMICTLFAAMSGTSSAGTVTMGVVALPAMLKRKYDKRMVMGSIMAGGALGVLIPPSIVMIVYGLLASVSVGKLFLAGVLPGLLLSALFIAYIVVRCAVNPSMGPPLPKEERVSWSEKLTSLRAVILPILLVVAVLGSIFGGLATPTEGAAVGAVGSVVCAAILRRFSWKMLKEASYTTLKLTSMVMWILLGATLFVSIYQAVGAPKLISNLFLSLNLSRWAVLALMMLTYFVLGCFVDVFGMLFITYPVFLPLATHFGFDLVWFGLLYVMSVEMAYLTPPVGANLFYMKALAPKNTNMGEIYRAVTPFVILQGIGLILVIIYPEIATWLPDLLIK